MRFRTLGTTAVVVSIVGTSAAQLLAAPSATVAVGPALAAPPPPPPAPPPSPPPPPAPAPAARAAPAAASSAARGGASSGTRAGRRSRRADARRRVGYPGVAAGRRRSDAGPHVLPGPRYGPARRPRPELHVGLGRHAGVLARRGPSLLFREIRAFHAVHRAGGLHLEPRLQHRAGDPGRPRRRVLPHRPLLLRREDGPRP